MSSAPAILLQVVSGQTSRLGERGSRRFGRVGGTIGRAPGNDWVLPDASRLLSARHARVRYSAGAWYLEDLSRNGSFVNGEPCTGRALHPGDLVTRGRYQMAVALEAEPGLEAEPRLDAEPRPEPREGPAPPKAPAGGKPQAGLEAFCQGAGVDPAALARFPAAEVLHLAGRLLREAVLGYKELERARRTRLESLGVDPSVDAEDSGRHPRLGLAVEEILAGLLSPRRSAEAVEWLREGAATGTRHGEALDAAARAGLLALAGQFEPDQLEARFRAVSRAGGASRDFATLYRDYYASLVPAGTDLLPHAYVEAFAEALRAALGTRGGR
jgi:predicted component of type VI protein secretion system